MSGACYLPVPLPLWPEPIDPLFEPLVVPVALLPIPVVPDVLPPVPMSLPLGDDIPDDPDDEPPIDELPPIAPPAEPAPDPPAPDPPAPPPPAPPPPPPPAARAALLETAKAAAKMIVVNFFMASLPSFALLRRQESLQDNVPERRN